MDRIFRLAESVTKFLPSNRFLDKAEKLFRYAIIYWDEAKAWSKKTESFKWIELPEVQAWEDEQFRIMNGDLDYQAIIEKHLGKLAQVRQTFKDMNKSTY